MARNLIISFLLFFNLPLMAQVQTIKGRVVDSETQSGIAYTNIGVEGTFYGTASDAQGFFELKIPDEFKTEKLFFSAVGYQNIVSEIPSLLQKEFVIVQLDEQTYSIENIDIAARSRVLFRVLKSAAANIPENYSQGPLGMKLYYEENLKNGEQAGRKREAVVELCDKTAYSSPSLADAFKNRGFRFMQVKRNFEVYSFPSGQNGFDELTGMDIVRLSSLVLNEKLLNNFDLQLEDISQYENDSVWIISYKTNKTDLAHTGDFYATELNGKIYISKNNYEILRNECIVKSTKNNAENRSLLAKNEAQTGVNYHFTSIYKKQNGKYALSYLSCEKTFMNSQQQESVYTRKASVLELDYSPQNITGKDYFENEVYVESFWNNFKRHDLNQ